MANSKDELIAPYGDAHVHSSYSLDGKISGGELLNIIAMRELKLLSITDHDNMQIYTALQEIKIGKKDEAVIEYNGCKIIPSVEVTCRCTEYPFKIHMIVAGAKRDSDFNRLLKLKFQNDKDYDLALINYISDKLGFNITLKDVQKFAKFKNKLNSNFVEMQKIDIPEFLDFLNYDYRSNREEIFRTISEFPSAHMKRLDLEIRDVIKLAHQAGGICILPHPRKTFTDKSCPKKTKTFESQKSKIKNVLSFGIDGIEVFCPSNQYNDDTYVKDLTSFLNSQEQKYIMTAGSDRHFDSVNSKIGYICDEPITKFQLMEYEELLQAVDCKRKRLPLTDYQKQLYEGVVTEDKFVSTKEAREIFDDYKRKYNRVLFHNGNFSPRLKSDTYYKLVLNETIREQNPIYKSKQAYRKYAEEIVDDFLPDKTMFL